MVKKKIIFKSKFFTPKKIGFCDSNLRDHKTNDPEKIFKLNGKGENNSVDISNILSKTFVIKRKIEEITFVVNLFDNVLTIVSNDQNVPSFQTDLCFSKKISVSFFVVLDKKDDFCEILDFIPYNSFQFEFSQVNQLKYLDYSNHVTNAEKIESDGKYISLKSKTRFRIPKNNFENEVILFRILIKSSPKNPLQIGNILF